MNEPLRLLLVDDEAPARQRMRELVGDLARDLPLSIAGEAADGVDALDFLAHDRVDLLLTDIRMPRLDGIQLALQLGSLSASPQIVFVTAFDQYAIRAFELSATDYLLKPVSAERLRATLDKALRLRASFPGNQLLSELAPAGRLHLRSTSRGRVVLVPVSDVLYLRADAKYVLARTLENEYLVDESLNRLEQEFPGRFLRAHRNCLVARHAICAVEHPLLDGGDGTRLLLLRGLPDRVPVSRRQWALIKPELNTL